MIPEEGSDVAKYIIDRFEELKVQRNGREPELRKVARLYRPHRQNFSTGRNDQLGLQDLYNSTTLMNANEATASMFSTLCNPANEWFHASHPDPDRAKYHPVKVWLDAVTRIMRASLSASVSNFYASAVPWTADSTIMGTGILVSDETPTGRLRISDRCLPLSSSVFGVDAHQRPNELIIERWLSAKQAAREYGYENLPEKLQKESQQATAGQTWQFLQAYQLNDEFVPYRLGLKGQRFLSTHVCVEGKRVVRQKGTREQPFSIPRYDYDADDLWGRGLGYMNLASAVKLQLQERDNQHAAGLASRPPVGTVGGRSFRMNAKLAPGAALHGAISPNGQQLVKPIFTFNGLPITVEMAKQTIDEIDRGWRAVLLSLQGRTGLNNLEVMERNEEMLRLQAPYIGNLQTEGLAPFLERRFGILQRAGQMPPPPPEMSEQPLEMKFTSVAAQALRAQEGVAIGRVLKDTVELASTHPDPASVWDAIDTDFAVRRMAEAKGAPAALHRAPEEIEARRAQRAAQQQAEQALAAASQAADIGQTLSQIPAEAAQ